MTNLDEGVHVQSWHQVSTDLELEIECLCLTFLWAYKIEGLNAFVQGRNIMITVLFDLNSQQS